MRAEGRLKLPPSRATKPDGADFWKTKKFTLTFSELEISIP